MSGKKVLIVITSASDLGGHPTGYWLEEVAAPYNVFRAAGLQVTLASITGGKPPVDANSLADMFVTEDCKRFKEDAAAQAALASTQPVSLFLEVAKAGQIDAVFLPGGHGTAADFPESVPLRQVLEAVYSKGGVVSAVCHGPCGLVNVTDVATGQPLVKGKQVTGFSNEEEEQVGLTSKVPFLLEDGLKEKGGVYSKLDPWTPHAVADGRLVTGQNPQSSHATAVKVVEVLKA
eukprot:GGOE01053750.1.p1 GENE.GGOE01053750.1~~GGOE01053750.1.p1  ORF type:complete len:253 (-),score=93.74 GGOE01053750.1:4-702(-)